MSVQPLEALDPDPERSEPDRSETGESDPACSPSVVRAAGVLPWRRKKGRLQVALVHRPRYDDWSWAKGKLDRGEDWAAAAAREAYEETGMVVRLGPRLPSQTYRLGRDAGGATKRVEYWAGHQIAGSGKLRHEVDKVVWLTPAKAERRLTYPRDAEQLHALVALAESGRLDTWTLLVVRHGKALARRSWKRPDMIRPLTTVGKRRAQRLVPILSAYAPEHILTSPSTRCHDTMAPFAQQAVVPLSTKRGFSEEGYEDRPYKVAKHLTNVFYAGRSVAICTHGPVLEAVMEQLQPHADSRAVEAVFRRVSDSGMDKGEVLACAVAGLGREARIVTATRHRIPR
jgi:phosphohistidine phosphatase SixA/predicted NUDIX family NTP pyrophosphohydrolase